MVVGTWIIDGKETKRVRFYISSLTSDADRTLQVVRRHWSIENDLYWALDVAFNEDHSRVRKDQAPENFAVLRPMDLNLLKDERTAKGGIHAKHLKLPGRKTTSSGSSLQAVKMRLPYQRVRLFA
jgi:hypothetical protein